MSSTRNTDRNKVTIGDIGGYHWMWQWRLDNGRIVADVRDIPREYTSTVERLRIHPTTGERRWIAEVAS